MSEPISETFARYAEGAAFRQWRGNRKIEIRFVYASKDDVIWKFTLEAWWRFVTRTIRNNGVNTLPLSNQLHGRPRNLSPSDRSIRFVDVSHWTLDNWKAELDSIK